MRQPYKYVRKKQISANDIKLIELMASGLGNKQISDRLKIKISTIEGRRYSLYIFLGVSNSCHLISWAYQNGILKINNK